MASKRSIPTSLFSSPDFFELSSDTIRLIMIGLILDADDEGRGSAHLRLLARKLDKCPEDIEQALVELQAHGILQCYEVSDRAYYVLCHWHKYQILSKPTPSIYPALPDAFPTEVRQNLLGHARETQESPGESSLEEEGEKEEEQEEKDKGNEDEGMMPPDSEPAPPFHPQRSSGDASLSPKNQGVKIDQIALYLQLPLTAELEAVAREFENTSTLSLIGEAIEARCWVNDHQRNRTRQPMTPAFFRRWLKRSRGDYGTREQGHGRSVPGTQETHRGEHRKAAVSLPEGSSQANDPYQAHVLRRLAEVKVQAQKKLEVVA